VTILRCPVVMHEPRPGSTIGTCDDNEYVTYRWYCEVCEQRSLCTFRNPTEADRYLASHHAHYCKGVLSGEECSSR
jgi:hypothetical protein